MTLPRPVLAGLIGAGIQASRTPLMHELEGARRGLRYIYRLIDLDPIGGGAELLPELLANAERFGFDGLNITHPCKQAIIPHLHELSEDAAAIGAVNTVVLAGGRRIGHNTDWWRFSESMRRRLDGAPLERVLQLGAGGAGSATAHALLKAGVSRLAICDTSLERAGGLAEDLNARFGPGRAEAVVDAAAAARAAQGVVQVTPVGMDKRPGMPLAGDALRPDHWVAEIIYFPLETAFLRHARAIGCRTTDGSGMAIFQAVGAFQLFTGIEPDVAAKTRDFFAMGSELAPATTAVGTA
jgi:shikimate dehydrogenase